MMNIYQDIPYLRNTAVALGCFDGIHLGHKAVIDAAEGTAQSTRLSRTVFSFSDAVNKNHSQHIATFEDKCRLLEQLGIENLIVPSFESVKDCSPEQFFREVLMQRLDAKLISCGENYRFGKNASGSAETMLAFCQAASVECKVISPVTYERQIISSSRIRKALSDGAVDKARVMLGRPFSYQFEVVSGRHLGRTLGTPTINQYFPENFLIPRYGVYASVTELEGRKYHSVTNIGIKPTVGWHKPLSETWIPDFSGDLYGQSIRINLVKFMRDECKFNSVEELKAAILQDGVNSKCLTADLIKNGGSAAWI